MNTDIRDERKSMRKRSLGTISFALAAIMTMTACGGQTTAPGPDSSISGTTEASVSDETSQESGETGSEAASEETSQAAENTDSGKAPSEAASEAATEKVFLKEEYSSQFVCIADLDGHVYGEYPIDDIRDIFNKSGSSFAPQDFLLEKDGILYYSCSEKDDSQTAKEAVFAVDPANGSVAEVVSFESNCYLDTFDYYKDAFRMSLLEGDYGTERNYRPLVIVKPDDSMTYVVEEDDSLSDFYKTISTYDEHVNRNENRRECYERVLDELGCVLREDDDVLYKVLADGSATELKGLPDNMSYTSAYDSDHLFFSCHDDNYNIEGIYSYDLSSGTCQKLSIAPYYDYFKSYQDGILYYSQETEKEYGISTTEIRCLDIKSGEDKSVIERTKVPGALSRLPLSEVIIKGDKIFFQDFQDSKFSWFMADIDDAEKTAQSTGIMISEIDTFDYGTVEYFSNTDDCPFCGTTLIKLYGEYFVLNPKFSEHADKINSVLRSDMEGRTSISENEHENQSADTCEEHLANPMQWCNTEDYSVTDVGIIDNRYLTVSIDGYWYGGGAHGYPSRDQYLFDLKTGDQLTLKDFYQDTEDEFKIIIAGKVKEDYEKYVTGEKDGYSPYFADTSDGAYEQAYSYVNFDNLYFYEDGIVYYFYPYDLGSYADGFIEIPVSYEELLGRKTLAE